MSREIFLGFFRFFTRIRSERIADGADCKRNVSQTLLKRADKHHQFWRRRTVKSAIVSAYAECQIICYRYSCRSFQFIACSALFTFASDNPLHRQRRIHIKNNNTRRPRHKLMQPDDLRRGIVCVRLIHNLQTCCASRQNGQDAHALLYNLHIPHKIALAVDITKRILPSQIESISVRHVAYSLIETRMHLWISWRVDERPRSPCFSHGKSSHSPTHSLLILFDIYSTAETSAKTYSHRNSGLNGNYFPGQRLCGSPFR